MGNDLKKQTLIIGSVAHGAAEAELDASASSGSGSRVEAAVVSPRLALPPPPHIRRSVMPNAEDLDSGWDSLRPSSMSRPASTKPSTLPNSSLSSRPGAYSHVSPLSVEPSSSAAAIVVRSASNVPVSRSPASPPPLAETPLSGPVSMKKPPVPVSRPPSPLFLAASLPPPPSSKKMFAPELEELPSSDVLDDDDRPSDRVTVPNGLAPKKIQAANDSEESSRSLATTRPPPPASNHPSLLELASALRAPPSPRLELADPDEAFTPSSLPPVSMDARPPLTSAPGYNVQSVPVPKVSRQWVAIFAGSHLAVAAGVLLFVYATRSEPPAHPREPRIALEDRMSMHSTAGAVTENVTPPDGCRVQDLSRVIATRAELGPALDAAALESGFGVGIVSKAHEATGIRLDATTLRTAETVKVRTVWPVTRVAVDKGDSEEDRLEVRVDGNDTKTLSATQKITAQKGGVFSTDANGEHHLLWGIPGYVPKTTETVRAIGRADGSAIVAVRRPGVMFVGVTGQGPLVPVMRDKRTLGTPTLAPTQNGGGVIAWAERETAGFSVVLATIDVDGKHTTVGEPTELVEGISPALATLPNGELLLTYSDGKAGAHRVVAQRLGPDLSRRGDLLVLSSDGLNAGQPAVAVDGEGRAIVAYLAIEAGRAEVHATSLSCR